MPEAATGDSSLNRDLAKQRERCSVLAAENEKLKSVGADAALATQWRQRYEVVVAEKEKLTSEVKMMLLSSEAPSTDYARLARTFRRLLWHLHKGSVVEH